VKRLALLLLAACGGGSAATQPTTNTNTPSASGDEDWRGYLSQIAGPPCTWIPGASFLACQVDGEPTTTLIGWEPNNRRYVAWYINADASVRELTGSASNSGWSFEGPGGHIDIKRASDTTWTISGISQADQTITVTPGAAPPTGPASPATSGDDWRNALEPFAGDWVFSGTERGETKVVPRGCTWIPASTFMSCQLDDGFQIMGFEKQNRRFVIYRFKPQIDVLVGTRDGKNWTFASASQRISYTHDTAIRRGYKEEAGGQIVADGTLETSVE
jgi:hypothetical protein